MLWRFWRGPRHSVFIFHNANKRAVALYYMADVVPATQNARIYSIGVQCTLSPKNATRAQRDCVNVYICCGIEPTTTCVQAALCVECKTYKVSTQSAYSEATLCRHFNSSRWLWYWTNIIRQLCSCIHETDWAIKLFSGSLVRAA